MHPADYCARPTLFPAREWRLTKNAGAPVWSIQSCANGPRFLAHAGRCGAAWRGARILDLGVVCAARRAARRGDCGAKRQRSLRRRNFRRRAAQPGSCRTYRNCDQAARRSGRLGRPARSRGGATRGEADSGGARGRGPRPRHPPGRSPRGSRHPGAQWRARNARLAGEEGSRAPVSSSRASRRCASRAIRRPASRAIRCSTPCAGPCPASGATGCPASQKIRPAGRE